jgi:hypothetical protein
MSFFCDNSSGFEERMSNMQTLTAAEEELYSTAQDVPEKVAELEKSMEGMMAGGHLTKAELAAMIKDLQEKEEHLQTLIATAGEDKVKLFRLRELMLKKKELLVCAHIKQI